jgi:hypothetical protein
VQLSAVLGSLGRAMKGLPLEPEPEPSPLLSLPELPEVCVGITGGRGTIGFSGFWGWLGASIFAKAVVAANT